MNVNFLHWSISITFQISVRVCIVKYYINIHIPTILNIDSRFDSIHAFTLVSKYSIATLQYRFKIAIYYNIKVAIAVIMGAYICLCTII